MERIRDIVLIAPFLALAFAVTYLQGYWGVFDIFPFPYLTFQELLAYSAMPIFGMLLYIIIGFLFGKLSVMGETSAAEQVEPKKWQDWVIRLLYVTISAIFIYKKLPNRWIIVPMLLLIEILPWIFRSKSMKTLKETHPFIMSSASILILMLFVSFGYGRNCAENLLQMKKSNALITWDSNKDEEIRMIGRLGGYYFYLDDFDQVNVRGEQYVRHIRFSRTKDENLSPGSSGQSLTTPQEVNR